MIETYIVPCISTEQITDADRAKLSNPDRDASEICCMYDPTDPNNGYFLWIDEEGEPPANYSAAFATLWQWAQSEGFTWVRLADWGDRMDIST
jgi:hypothetical protein